MKCLTCESEWIPSKGLNTTHSNCPFCGTEIVDIDKAQGLKNISDFLQYLISIYGKELYNDKQKLANLIQDLYAGEDRDKRLYRRATLEDAVSQHVYAIGLKNINERLSLLNQLTYHFCEENFYSQEIGKQIIDAFVYGLGINLKKPISTKPEDGDGEWLDEFGVKYSADRKKLIEAPSPLAGKYQILDKCEVICDYALGDLGLKRYLELVSINIPSSVTSIGISAFSGCGSLTSISIPSSITSIGDKAFEGCHKLTSISIPSSVSSIGDRAFGWCINLTSISIPSSVRTIGDAAFSRCRKLISISIPSSVRTIGDGVFSGCSSLTSISIPSSVTSIGDAAFRECSSLISISIPSSVTSIGDSAFRECSSLISISIPSSVTSIGDLAFKRCSNLTSISIPSSVTYIGFSVFEECSNLISISIPNSVTCIRDSAFDCCLGLTIIYIPKGSKIRFEKLLPKYRNLLVEE